MKHRLAALAVTAAAAAVLPLCTATSAGADPSYTVRGAYLTQEQCVAAGQAGYQLWGPNFLCQPGTGGYIYLLTH
ncbi:hypothetical protein ACIQGZ_27025 [Streptomyces sp. NPDC092296]|uniref:hypothetical protein n=1 Tax=Streptomyces sp. NPDC092296 TaxID=3366012 RepID=UPI00382137F2